MAAEGGRVAATHQKFANPDNIVQRILGCFQHEFGKAVLVQWVERGERHGGEGIKRESVGHNKQETVEDFMVELKQEATVCGQRLIQLLRFIIQI